jgi:hypothetical protein
MAAALRTEDIMKNAARFIFVGMVVILANLAFAQARPGEWLTISQGEFCVTEGAVEKASDDRMSVDVSKMRAYVTTGTAQSSEIRFRYVGATSKESALGSGQMRRQLGLKLRAQDPCNLVYAIWRIDPVSELVVSVKRNPSEHTSAQCTNHGYTNIKPRKASPVPRLQPGDSHTLRAEMKEAELRVYVDNNEVWEGDVGADAAKLDGPVGIRSDNARFEFDFKARKPEDNRPPWPCKKGDSD